jgi:hypothetical protein
MPASHVPPPLPPHPIWSDVHVQRLIFISIEISFIVMRRFSRMRSSTAAIISGVTTWCVCPGRGDSSALCAPFLHFWEKNEWFYEGQHGFRPGYSCESQTVTVCQDIADSLDEGERIDSIIIDFSSWPAAYKNNGFWGGFEGSRIGKAIHTRSHSES